jgi:hypothetical protein
MDDPAMCSKGQQSAGYRRLFRLLTGGLLVRFQPEEPIFSHKDLAPRHFPIVNNREQFGSDFVDRRTQRAIDHLGVHVQRRVHLRVPHQLSYDLGRHALLVSPR